MSSEDREIIFQQVKELDKMIDELTLRRDILQAGLSADLASVKTEDIPNLMCKRLNNTIIATVPPGLPRWPHAWPQLD